MAKTRLPAATAEAVKARSGGLCEAQVPGVCAGRGEHLHHRKFRSGGEDHSIPNVIDACDPCHRFFHADKRHAMKWGWAITSHAAYPAEEYPILWRGEMSLLTTDGGVEPIRTAHPSMPVEGDPWKATMVD